MLGGGKPAGGGMKPGGGGGGNPALNPRGPGPVVGPATDGG